MRTSPVQMYESVVQSNDTNSALFFVTVPRRSLPEFIFELEGSQGASNLPLEDVLPDQLGVQPLLRIESSALSGAIAALVSESPDLYQPIYDTSWEAAKHFYLQNFVSNPSLLRLSPAKQEFVDYLVASPIVPFENSPLGAASLFDIVTKASAPGIGAYIGFVVSGNSPLLLITVPAGMVICGAASGVAKGLEEGLRSKVKSLISKKR